MTIFHHKLLTREGRVLANGWTHPSSMTIFVHLFIRSVIRKVTTSDTKYHLTLNIIFSVHVLQEATSVAPKLGMPKCLELHTCLRGPSFHVTLVSQKLARATPNWLNLGCGCETLYMVLWDGSWGRMLSSSPWTSRGHLDENLRATHSRDMTGQTGHGRTDIKGRRMGLFKYPRRTLHSSRGRTRATSKKPKPRPPDPGLPWPWPCFQPSLLPGLWPGFYPWVVQLRN